MKRIIHLLIVVVVATVFLTSCGKEPYYNYVIEGRVIDKTTKEPVEGIMVSFHRYDDLLSSERIIQKKSPPEYDALSDENGKFLTHQTYPCAQIYFYGYHNGLYKDTIISVDFSNVTLSGTAYKKYKGDYILCLGDVELEKNN